MVTMSNSSPATGLMMSKAQITLGHSITLSLVRKTLFSVALEWDYFNLKERVACEGLIHRLTVVDRVIGALSPQTHSVVERILCMIGYSSMWSMLLKAIILLKYLLIHWWPTFRGIFILLINDLPFLSLKIKHSQIIHFTGNLMDTSEN